MRQISSLIFLVSFSVYGVTATKQSSSSASSGSIYVLGEYGSAVVPIQTAGFSAGAPLTRDMDLEFTYAQGMKDVDYAKMYARMYSIKLKKYWFGSSFYTNSGFGYRVVKDRTTSKASDKFYVERHGRAPGIDLSVGNRWQFGNFAVGCDWVGFFHPLSYNRNEAFVWTVQRPGAAARGGSSRGEGSQKQRGGSSGQQRGSDQQRGGSQKTFDRHQTDWDRLSKHGTLQLMRLSIGYHF